MGFVCKQNVAGLFIFHFMHTKKSRVIVDLPVRKVKRKNFLNMDNFVWVVMQGIS